MGWRSQEMSYSLEQQTKAAADGVSAPPKVPLDAQIPMGLPAHFYNEQGEIDLRNVSGEEAYRFMMAQGIKLPIVMGSRGGGR